MLYRLRCLRTYVSTRQARIQNVVLRILMQRQSAFGNPIPAGGGVGRQAHGAPSSNPGSGRPLCYYFETSSSLLSDYILVLLSDCILLLLSDCTLVLLSDCTLVLLLGCNYRTILLSIIHFFSKSEIDE
jgi:hypothetical protein